MSVQSNPTPVRVQSIATVQAALPPVSTWKAITNLMKDMLLMLMMRLLESSELSMLRWDVISIDSLGRIRILRQSIFTCYSAVIKCAFSFVSTISIIPNGTREQCGGTGSLAYIAPGKLLPLGTLCERLNRHSLLTLGKQCHGSV